MTLWQLILRHIFWPLGRLLGTARFDPHVTAAVHCVGCGHRYVLVINERAFATVDDDGPIEDVECHRCGRELVFVDSEVDENE
jgi:ribosomal protein S27E